MIEQPTLNYESMFVDLVKRHNALTTQRNEIDIEIAKLKQLILATAPLLPEDKQKKFQAEIDDMETQSAGLLDAIKLVFSAHREEWLTASEVRNHLMAMGFDFKQYKTNPLASIATTLKRMVPAYLDSRTSLQTGSNYKRRETFLESMGRSELIKRGDEIVKGKK